MRIHVHEIGAPRRLSKVAADHASEAVSRVLKVSVVTSRLPRLLTSGV